MPAHSHRCCKPEFSAGILNPNSSYRSKDEIESAVASHGMRLAVIEALAAASC